MSEITVLKRSLHLYRLCCFIIQFSGFVLAGHIAIIPETYAGTTGGLYDFRALLAAPHPFAGDAGQFRSAPAVQQPSRAPVPLNVPTELAPPPPVLRYTPLPQSAPTTPTPQQPALRADPPPPINPQTSPTQTSPTQTSPSQAAAPAVTPRLAETRPQSSAATEPAGYDPNRDGLLGWLAPWFNRPYLAASIGGADVSTRRQITAGTPVDYEWDFGVNADVGAGWRFGEAFRAEINVGYWFLPLDQARSGNQSTTADGDFTAFTFMLNGFYDYDLGPDVRPFVGLGLGSILIDIDDVTLGIREIESLDANYFAYQGILGLAWQFRDNAEATIDYRYVDSTADDVTLQRLNLGIRLAL